MRGFVKTTEAAPPAAQPSVEWTDEVIPSGSFLYISWLISVLQALLSVTAVITEQFSSSSFMNL